MTDLETLTMPADLEAWVRAEPARAIASYSRHDRFAELDCFETRLYFRNETAIHDEQAKRLYTELLKELTA